MLRGNQIEVYNFAPEISQVTLTSIGIIDSDSFPLFEEFEPIEIVQDYYCELLVYDFSNGLVVIGLADDFDSFNFTSKGLIGNIQNSEVKMAYNCSRLVITPTGSNSDYGLVMLDRITNLVSTFPVMPGCSYSSISITLNFIAVFCDDILDNRVLVFD